MFTDVQALIDERHTLTVAFASGYVTKDVYDRDIHALDLSISSILRKV